MTGSDLESPLEHEQNYKKCHPSPGGRALGQRIQIGKLVKHSGIREAVIGDAQPIARLVTELGYRTSPDAMRERLGRLLDNQDYVTYVAESGGEVVGVSGGTLDLYYERNGVYARLAVLAVAPSARGTGVGRQLVETIERWAASRGARELFVNSGFHRPGAHAFYERCGFTRTGFRFVKQLDALG